MVKFYLVGAIALILLLYGCASTVNVPDLNEEIFSGNYECSIDWSDLSESDNYDRNAIVEHWVWQEWNVNPTKSKELQNCIDTQATAKCYLLSAMYKNQPELCENFDETYTFETWSPPSMSSGEGGGSGQMDCRYREICSAFVTLFNEK